MSSAAGVARTTEATEGRRWWRRLLLPPVRSATPLGDADSLSRAVPLPCSHVACKDCALDALGSRREADGHALCPLPCCDRRVASVERRRLRKSGRGRGDTRSSTDAPKRVVYESNEAVGVKATQSGSEGGPLRASLKGPASKGGGKAVPPGGVLPTSAWSMRPTDRGGLSVEPLRLVLPLEGHHRPEGDDASGLSACLSRSSTALTPLDRAKRTVDTTNAGGEGRQQLRRRCQLHLRQPKPTSSVQLTPATAAHTAQSSIGS